MRTPSVTYAYIAALLVAPLVNALPFPLSHSPFRHRSSLVMRNDNETSTPSPPPASGNPKYVFAHHMVGNTFPYTVDNWVSDIQNAHGNGIDAFALNIGSDDWQPQRVADAYQAAANSGTDFKLFISFDMSILPCSSPDDAAALRNYITQYSSHPNQLIVNGRVFASTFSGENCNFGQGSVANGWKSQFTQHPQLTGQNAVYFVPSFFVDPSTFNQYDGVLDGDFNWNGGWPTTLTTASATSLVGSLLSIGSNAVQTLSSAIGAFTTDAQHLSALQSVSNSPSYMAAVSPWFFTHYGPNSYNKNFIYYADSHLYPTRWDTIISNRDKVDFAEIITWNDYGESHYIGPIEGAQPNSQAWVDGLDHQGFLQMTNYYATAFKTGSYPAITEDKIYLWARTHPKEANSPDGVVKPTNFELTQDTLWAVIFATQPSSVTLATSDSNSQTFSVPAGVSKLSFPLTPGGYMHGTISRNGQSVVDLKPPGYSFNPNPPSYNFNVFVAAST